jgi:hypothetical protein
MRSNFATVDFAWLLRSILCVTAASGQPQYGLHSVFSSSARKAFTLFHPAHLLFLSGWMDGHFGSSTSFVYNRELAR